MTNRFTTLASAGTVGDALEQVAGALAAAEVYYGHGTDSAWDEAVQLVLAVAELPAESDDTVLAQPLAADQAARMAALLQRRIDERVPLPYLLGHAWFAGLRLHCDERAIIPRSPLAELILCGFEPWYSGPSPTRILDMCCGGGCIGLASAWYLPDCEVDLLDLDPDALALARDNIALLGLHQRVRTLQSDLFSALGGERYDLVLANPPYVDAGDLATMPPEYQHEPALALGSGDDGLDLTRRLLAQAEGFLHPWGLLVLEVGNSWEALEHAYPGVPFTWVEFEQGGHGVLVLTAKELRQCRESLHRSLILD
ncbi:50S ribosomal protein L3 N(5)-glutamine methyltransferase [Kineobactrum sediminis]|uniref:50S ribosomal protein L3 N(5)-glutamine methyltransferase n=1 Tax=Kineobactrum sediminis TaxID=1905677 RepID=A0A2N5Y4G5_9GAMM|nr:50S ribosomal protein L3 N(5)-glutamine methyltransferase [Kineobactrum sediminis]PLW83285.1 50S ribosomal protein L3 N(5)-glutamine methyltransferase [Kineobactrum sediminis]